MLNESSSFQAQEVTKIERNPGDLCDAENLTAVVCRVWTDILKAEIFLSSELQNVSWWPLIYCIWRPSQTWDGDTVFTPPSPRLHPFNPSCLGSVLIFGVQMNDASWGRAGLMLGPARWHWQLNYPTGRGGWLSAEKSSGRPNLPPTSDTPIPNLSTLPSPCPHPRPPLSPLVKRGTPSPSSPHGSSWQVISTVTITAITGVINKWPTPSQGNNKGFIIHHARPYKYMPTGNK